MSISNTKTLKQPAAIAVASTTTFPASYNTFELSGNGTMNTVGASERGNGQIIRCIFTGTPTLTYHASNLILKGGANLVLAAGDVIDFMVIGTNQVQQVAVKGVAALSSTGTGLVEPLNFIIDGGSSAITTGVKGDFIVPYACTIQSATLLADQSGSIVVDLWKDTYANFPPVVGDSITASAKPTLSSANKAQNTTLTGWTTSIAAGDVIRVNVDSASTVQRVLLSLKVVRA